MITWTLVDKVAAETTHISGNQLNAPLTQMGFHKFLHYYKMFLETTIINDIPS
jgi:hypothetical protein